MPFGLAVNHGKNTAIYILHEQEKIFIYDLQRIREVKASIFTPPAISTGV